jgi:hypothetical protein
MSTVGVQYEHSMSRGSESAVLRKEGFLEKQVGVQQSTAEYSRVQQSTV